MTRKTKILATLGPSSSSDDVIRSMMLSGVNGFRLNFAHGTLVEKYELIGKIRRISEELGVNVSIVADIPGRGPRIGSLPSDYLNIGEKVVLVFGSSKSDNPHIIPVPKEEILRVLDVNDEILLADGRIIVRVERIIGNEAEAQVISDGAIRSNVSITVRHKPLPFPALSDRDREFVKFAVKNDVDYIALSFIQTPEDILELRGAIHESGGQNIKVIAKIETKPAINNIDGILKETDSIMIARGDLGVQFSLEDIPYLENFLIKKSLQAGVPVILATQVLESMISSPVPTRAEVMDIATAVEKGVDVIMLSGETAIGKYPVKTVDWLRRIIENVEKGTNFPRYEPSPDSPVYIKFNRSIVSMAEYLDAIIVAFTTRGYTAKAISRFRSKQPTYIITNNKRTLNQLALIWGIEAIYLDKETIKLEDLDYAIKSRGYHTKKRFVIMTLGWRREESNMQEIRVEETLPA